MVQRQTNLTANVIAFCRYLRSRGFGVGPNEERDALLAIELTQPLNQPERLELCLQIALCRTVQQIQQFSDLYQQYWRELERAVDSKAEKKAEERPRKSKPKSGDSPGVQTLKNWMRQQKNNDQLATATYSDGGYGHGEAQVSITTEEMREIFQLVARLVEKLANRRNRQFRYTRGRGRLDLQKTLRKNIVRYGEMVELWRRNKRKDQLQVVLLCDVSRSMELYSRFFVQFMYAFQRSFPRVETFAFAQELHHLTPHLQEKSVNDALERVVQELPDWSGGTRIGSALRTFNEQYAHRFVTPKTLVLVLSDGWDTDPVDLVGPNMRKIYRKALNVLWFNPLAGRPDWQPNVRGMRAALPYVDALLPLYNVESLRVAVRQWRV